MGCGVVRVSAWRAWLAVAGLMAGWVALEVWAARWKRSWTPPRCPHCRTRLDGLRSLTDHACLDRTRDRSP